jgi:hypothetical protein
MTLDEFRKTMWAYREAAEREANAMREPNLAWDRLRGLYRGFDALERNLADQVLCEWLLNDDENVRYDSLVLIDEFGIKRALPALTELAPRLKRSKAPGAPYELQKVQSILSRLSN